MPTQLRRRPSPAARREQNLADDERETALLAEFMRHDTVASLAAAIAGRLGGGVRKNDLVDRAGLGPARRSFRPEERQG